MDTQKQQVAERIRQANNILVTVSTNPSVDQLAACLALTLSLNKMGKHATAVFSGAIPSTIEFLQPEKTIEKNTDSLRDFIIALDKAKADKLRYKVEDRVVKIFITPYRTSISDKDLEFSQGDFNVDVVVALGVHAQADLDQAITSHGRILHDATVISMNVRPGGELGSLNWLDPNASSLSELTVQLVDMLDKKLLDGQIATAMLTGIVAETERFSNAKTSPQTMSISAQLMSVGANQQLVATKLEEPLVVPQTAAIGPIAQQDAHKGDATDVPAAPKKPDDGTLEITHDAGKDKDVAKDQTDNHAGADDQANTHDNNDNKSGWSKTNDKPSEPLTPPESLQSDIAIVPPTPQIHDIKSDAQQATGKLLPVDEPHAASTDTATDAPSLPAPQPESQIEFPVTEPTPEPTPPPQINIDEHGSMSPLGTDLDGIDESALPPLEPQQPPSISHHSEAPKMILEPPTLGGQLTANASSDAFGAGGEDEESPSGMPGMPEHEMPMLGGAPSPETLAAPAGMPSLLPPTDQEVKNAPGTSFLGDQPLEDNASTVSDNKTLTDIEKSVHSSHLNTATGTGDANNAMPPSAPADLGQAPTTPAPLMMPTPPAPSAESGFIETPIPSDQTPTAPPSDGANNMLPPIPVMTPDDLTPDEVANVFGTPLPPQPQPQLPAMDAPLAPTNSPADAFVAPPAPEVIPDAPAADQGQALPSDERYGNLDNARDAVMQAINGNPTPPLEPIKALNANPFGAPLDNGAPEQPALAGQFDTPASPAAPVQPWSPPAAEPVLQGAVAPNPATQFDPAAFGGQDEGPNAPPPGPPPMMPSMQ
ncbi:MAG: hypothetical protein ABWX94_02805 [Candidatus Saccharimonadales bacterium]